MWCFAGFFLYRSHLFCSCTLTYDRRHISHSQRAPLRWVSTACRSLVIVTFSIALPGCWPDLEHVACFFLGSRLFVRLLDFTSALITRVSFFRVNTFLCSCVAVSGDVSVVFACVCAVPREGSDAHRSILQDQRFPFSPPF